MSLNARKWARQFTAIALFMCSYGLTVHVGVCVCVCVLICVCVCVCVRACVCVCSPPHTNRGKHRQSEDVSLRFFTRLTLMALDTHIPLYNTILALNVQNKNLCVNKNIFF